MDNQTEIKKVNTGKIGFILSLASLAVSLLLFIPPILLVFVFLLFPPLALCLLILLSFFFCIHGLIKNRSRKTAITGIFVNIVTIILLFFAFITFTPPGSIPHPLNIYKFKRACPEAAFWLDYEKKHITDFGSMYTGILVKFGTVYYSSQADAYKESEVIELAEDNGWKYHLKVSLSKTDFENYHKNLFSEFEDPAVDCIWYIQAYTRVPFRVKEDCDVLIFETGNVHGIPSYILVSNDKSKMEVRFASPALPDSGYKFYVPEYFTELHTIQSENKKEIK